MFGKVNESLWQDSNFIKLSETARLLYLYLLTNKHRGILGVYRLPLAYIEADTGIKGKPLTQALNDLVDIGYIEYDNDNEVVLIVKYLQINNHYNYKHIQGGIREIQELKLSNVSKTFKSIISKIIETDANQQNIDKFKEILTIVEQQIDNTLAIDCQPIGNGLPVSISISNSISNSKEGGVGGEKKSDLELVKEIHQKLCDESGKNFKLTEAVKTSIRARLNDGFTKEEIFEAIEKQVANCKENNVPQYMHPSTVFRNTTSIERAISYQPKKQNNGKIVIADDDPLNFL
jgi:uncharacterized phage protein (TIGR02220 family)